jgi:ABC-type antimicrobial peptide transport system, ATPase component
LHSPESSQLSGGQQQRVAIGRALSAKPAIILADEPTGNLDTKNSRDVINLLKLSVERYKQTLIMITHNQSYASFADRVLGVEDGIVTDLGGVKK